MDLELCQVFSGPDYYFKIDNGDEFYSVTVVYQSKNFTGESSKYVNETLSLGFYPLSQLANPTLGIKQEFFRKMFKNVILGYL